MHDGLIVATNFCVIVIQWIALITIVFGALEAFVRAVGIVFGSRDDHSRQEAWLRFGRWLVAGLTFLLAADILETAITTGWEEVGRLAAIAAIRTGLNYFLERDLREFRARLDDAGAPAA
jgi:uncharacterized membrane protein